VCPQVKNRRVITYLAELGLRGSAECIKTAIRADDKDFFLWLHDRLAIPAGEEGGRGHLGILVHGSEGRALEVLLCRGGN
jgi:hypothetical protein